VLTAARNMCASRRCARACRFGSGALTFLHQSPSFEATGSFFGLASRQIRSCLMSWRSIRAPCAPLSLHRPKLGEPFRLARHRMAAAVVRGNVWAFRTERYRRRLRGVELLAGRHYRYGLEPHRDVTGAPPVSAGRGDCRNYAAGKKNDVTGFRTLRFANSEWRIASGE
jgi:hypothetical protein